MVLRTKVNIISWGIFILLLNHMTTVKRELKHTERMERARIHHRIG